jgi:hypothetical protein
MFSIKPTHHIIDPKKTKPVTKTKGSTKTQPGLAIRATSSAVADYH